MAINYALPKPVAGTPRAGEEVSLMVDVSDTIADIDTRITANANATSSPPLGLKSGLYYRPPVTAVTTLAVVQDRLYAHPMSIPAAVTLDRIEVEVTTAAALTTIRMGIYNDDGGTPGTLLLDAGTVDSSTTGRKSITISQSINAGIYWLASVAQGGTPTVRASNGPSMLNMPSANGAGQGNVPSLAFVAGVSGALPDPFGFNVAATAFSGMLLAVRVA